MELNQLAGEKVLVTGATGFIGSHLCRRLQSERAEVHGVYRTQQPVEQGEVRWWREDLSDEGAVRSLFLNIRPTVIFHLASHVKGAPGLQHVLPTFRSNLQSAVNLMTVAAEAGCRRLVLTGSLAEPDPQNGELFPSAPYAAAKWATSGYARMFHALYQLPVVIARVFMVYGPAQVDLTKLIPYVILTLLRGETPKISSGNRLVDWIYVSDAVEGLIALGKAQGVDGTTVDLGSGSLVSIRDIVQEVVSIAAPGARAEFGALPDRPMEPTRVAQIADSLAKIGWRPRVSLRDGLERTVAWYQGQVQCRPEMLQSVKV